MISEKTISKLINTQQQPLLTITLPTHKKGEESKQDPIRFKNLLSEAAEQLSESGMKEADVTSFLKPAAELLEKPLFWAHSEQALAIYISQEQFTTYPLPYEVKEQVYLNDHFLITPLLPMVSIDGTFCMLAVSRQKPRLLQCTRNEVTDITPANIPKGVSDYLEVTPEKELQFHTGAEGSDAMFFGHGSGREDRKIVVEQYFREVERDITAHMNRRNDPLILIGLEDNLSFYNSINDYSHTVSDNIDDNPDTMNNRQLREHGWGVIQQYFLKDMFNTLERLKKIPDDKFSTNLSEIIESTIMGKSETVFISKGEKRWGVYDEENQTVHYSHSQENNHLELLNWLSIKTYETGGKVYMLPKDEMPAHSTVAAEFRF